MDQRPSERQEQSSTDELKAQNKKLRSLIDGLDLTPEETRDDILVQVNRDVEILQNKPPHHGN